MMINGIRFLLAAVMIVGLTPLALAETSGIKIMAANLKVEQSMLKGLVKICNTENEDIHFLLEAKNMNTNQLYKRHLRLPAGSCDNARLNFSGDFAEMSNTGDMVRLSLKKAIGKKTLTNYSSRNSFETKVEETTKNNKCKDTLGKDGIYTNLCVGDFIYHQPSGLRIKLKAKDSQKVDLLVNHIKWGGTKQVRIYQGREAELKSGNSKRVKIAHLEENASGTLSLMTY